MSDNKISAEDSVLQHQKLATRRKFLKSAAAAGAVAALYTAPKITSAFTRPAYASLTGSPSADGAVVITFESAAGTELETPSGGGNLWQESGYDIKAFHHFHRATNGDSVALRMHADETVPGRFEISCTAGGTFSISSLEIDFVSGAADISSNKGGSTGLTDGINNLVGSNWTGVSLVTIVTVGAGLTNIWLDNVSVSKP